MGGLLVTHKLSPPVAANGQPRLILTDATQAGPRGYVGGPMRGSRPMIKLSRTLPLTHWLLALLVLAIMAGAALAGPAHERAGEARRHLFGDDLFAAGSEVRVSEPNVKDVFAAGETVTVDSELGDTAHTAGRQVRINRPVGRNVYAFGYNVDVQAPVGADVIAAGY